MALWPEDFVERMRGWLGAESDDFLAAMAKRDVGLRLNPSRGESALLRTQLPWTTAPVPWCPEGLVLRPVPYADSGAGDPDPEVSIGVHPYHIAGVYYGQDPSAMAAAVLLDPQPGEWVLDLAAAPGSKATHIAARMQGDGLLVANDVSRKRTTVLAMNLERMGVTNAVVTNAYPERLSEAWPGLFDAMLVDAPCSGEGTFSREPQALRDWSLDTVRSYAARQQRILDQAAPLVRRGGRVLYGTCTFSPEENEGVIAGFLSEHPEFEIADLPAVPGMSAGHPEWIGVSEDLRRAGRFWPHTGPGHGHFFALLRRTGRAPEDLPVRWTGQNIPGRILRLYEKTLAQVLVHEPPVAGLVLTKDDECYITPMAPDLLSRVPVLRRGWWVASLRHDKILPDHALAMALRPDDVQYTVRLSPGDQRLPSFLDGGFWIEEGRQTTEPSGFALVTVDGFPLGWAKSDSSRVRSRYPVHLRRGAALTLG